MAADATRLGRLQRLLAQRKAGLEAQRTALEAAHRAVEAEKVGLLETLDSHLGAHDLHVALLAARTGQLDRRGARLAAEGDALSARVAEEARRLRLVERVHGRARAEEARRREAEDLKALLDRVATPRPESLS